MRLRQLRVDNGMTQSEVAAQLNVSLVTYNRYENQNTEPTASVLTSLSKLYGVSIEYILGLHDEKGNPVSFIDDSKTSLEQEMESTFKQLSIDQQYIILGKAKELILEK